MNKEKKEKDWWKDFKVFLRIIDSEGQLRVAFGKRAVIIPKVMMDTIFSFLTENYKDFDEEDKSLALEMISLFLQTPTLELDRESEREKIIWQLKHWMLDEKMKKKIEKGK